MPKGSVSSLGSPIGADWDPTPNQWRNIYESVAALPGGVLIEC